ncbi:HlyD family secretion protein [Martelella mediterranea]|uniref:Multidrug resistance efflux pump n=1 Tax=Martelella mediterranea TaxID=293089 RepID=A0A4R3NDL4_9HYPH|nr:HlyD family secretion protein [Martelella mediterranea]TCT29634.1 multidrug resistance efflux pump [Martelella mediterranea]
MTRIIRSLASYFALAVGIAGIVALLFAWSFPPFNGSETRTDNAYIQGQVTLLSPQLSGLVADVPVRDFQTVKAGDLIVQLDDRIYLQQLSQAEANVDAANAALDTNAQSQETAKAQIASAEAGVSSADASLANAMAQWKRMQSLNEKSIASQSDLDKARAAFDQAKASVAQAQASVEVTKQALKTTLVDRRSLEAKVTAAQAARELAQINLDNTAVTAPRDGKLGQVKAHVGQYVSAGSQLVALVPDTVWVIANYKETQLPGMKVGQKVTFTVDALNGEEFTGKIENFSPASGSQFSVITPDNATGNFTKVAQRVPVRIAIDPGQNDAVKLEPGLSVVTSIDTKQN